MRRIEWPEAELILEELEKKYKLEGDVFIKSYDSDNPKSLELEHIYEGYVVDPKKSYALKLELIFLIFKRMTQ